MQDRLIFTLVRDGSGLRGAGIDVKPLDAGSGIALVVAEQGGRAAGHDGLSAGGVQEPWSVC